MSNSFLVIYVIALMQALQHTHAGLHWTIRTKPIVIGEHVELFCNTPESIGVCPKCIRKWHTGSYKKLLTFNGKSQYPSKYKTVITSSGFSLVIQNFTKDDMKDSFICTFEFESVRKQLVMDENFEYCPSESISKNFTVTKTTSELNLMVLFAEVKPIPECYLFLNDKNITNFFEKSISEMELFYYVTYSVMRNLSLTSCLKKLKMNCSIGTFHKNLINNDSSSACQENSSTTEIPIIIAVSIVVVAVTCVGIFVYIKVQKKKKDAYKIVNTTNGTSIQV